MTQRFLFPPDLTDKLEKALWNFRVVSKKHQLSSRPSFHQIGQALPVFYLDPPIAGEAMENMTPHNWRFLVRVRAKSLIVDMNIERDQFVSISEGEWPKELIATVEALRSKLPADAQISMVESPGNRIVALWIVTTSESSFVNFDMLADGKTKTMDRPDFIAMVNAVEAEQREAYRVAREIWGDKADELGG